MPDRMENPLTPAEVRVELAKGKQCHRDWKDRFHRALVNAPHGLDPVQVARDDLSSFGVFLHTAPLAPWVTERKPYAVILRLHKEFHQHAGDLVRAIQTADSEAAERIRQGPYETASTKLMLALDKWDGELALLHGRRHGDGTADG